MHDVTLRVLLKINQPPFSDTAVGIDLQTMVRKPT